MDFGVFVVAGIVIAVILIAGRYWKMTPEERDVARTKAMNEYAAQQKMVEAKKQGAVNPEYICPHCQKKGFVHTKAVKKKQGISGAKATGAVLTLGLSMLATGLSRKEELTQAHCNNCGSTWDF